MATYEIPPQVLDLLNKATTQSTRLALLTCGLSGSGKSTLARALISRFPNFVRFSTDATILSLHGRYELDYPPSLLSRYQDEAESKIKGELGALLREGKRDVVLDMSFYSREMRGVYRGLIETEGGGRYRVVVVVFRAEEEVLWGRIEERQKRDNAEGGGEGDRVDREMLKRYIEGFEWPVGEGEVVVRVE